MFIHVSRNFANGSIRFYSSEPVGEARNSRSRTAPTPSDIRDDRQADKRHHLVPELWAKCNLVQKREKGNKRFSAEIRGDLCARCELGRCMAPLIRLSRIKFFARISKGLFLKGYLWMYVHNLMNQVIWWRHESKKNNKKCAERIDCTYRRGKWKKHSQKDEI